MGNKTKNIFDKFESGELKGEALMSAVSALDPNELKKWRVLVTDWINNGKRDELRKTIGKQVPTDPDS